MNETEHVFPLPVFEQHKLDEVKEEIIHPISRRMRRALAENAWTAIAVSAAAGLVCGLAWGRRG
jgi:ElaB/YqjD/DUF883 family membrane-anchored ribosome-binding protein